MRLSDLWLLMRKDVVLMWRDKSIFIVFLLICLPFTQLLRPALQDKGLLPKGDFGRENAVLSAPWTSPSDGSVPEDFSEDAPAIRVGMIGEKTVPGLATDKISVVTFPREAGIAALRAGTIDLLTEFPDNLIPSSDHAPSSMVRVNVVYNSARWSESRSAIERLQQRLRTLELENRRALVSHVRKSHADWLLCSVQYHTMNHFVDTRLSPAVSMKVGLLSSPLVLAGALIAALVMLVIVEENARHTLPLVLVCAVDRRTVFLSKMALCMVPATGVVISMMFRFSTMISKLHLPFSDVLALTATAGGAGLLFVFIFCSILVAAGGRSRNNVEALAKVGAPTLLCGFIVAMAYSPLSAYTPGLILFPLTNTVFLLQELLSGHPNPLTCLTALSSSAFFALLLVRNGALAMRTEQGLSGDVSVSDPKLDSLLLFLLASSAAVLLTNFIGIPASIVYPSVGSLAYATILLVVGAGIYRFHRIAFRRLLWDDEQQPPLAAAAAPTGTAASAFASASDSAFGSVVAGRNRILFASVCALILAFLTSFAFSSASPAGSISSEIARIEAVTRGAADSGLLFSLALLRSATEELILRGFLVSLLTPFFSPTIIIGLMCCLGASIHPLADTWPLMLVLSALLTTVRLFSRSVIPCVVLALAHTTCLWLLWHRVVQ